MFSRIRRTTREECKVHCRDGRSKAGHQKLVWLKVTRKLFKSAWNIENRTNYSSPGHEAN